MVNVLVASVAVSKLFTVPAARSEENTLAPTAWCNKMLCKVATGTASNEASVAKPLAAKAAFVGAKTVKGPAPLNAAAISAPPLFFTRLMAYNNLEKFGLAATVPVIVVAGGINTLLITCMIPLLAATSACTTSTPLI